MERLPASPAPDTAGPGRPASLFEWLKIKERWQSRVRILNQNGFLSIIPETRDLGYHCLGRTF